MSLTPDAISAIQIALPSLQSARERLWNQINGMWRRDTDQSVILDEEDMPSLEWQLDELRGKVIVVYEIAGLRYGAEQFDLTWRTLPTGRTDLTYDSRYLDGYRSQRLDHTIRAIEALRIFSEDQNAAQRFLRGRVETLLRSAGHILERRQVVPTKEKELQDVVEDYLRAAFPEDFVSAPQFHGVVKNFKADTGIRGAHLAIEYKWADSETRAKQCASGLFEDSAAYRGSEDWRHFISLIYTTRHFVTEAQLRADFQRVGAIDWIPIVVVGGK